MFPTQFFHTDANMNNIGKTPQIPNSTQQQNTSSPPSKVQSQSFSSAPSQSSSSTELSTAPSYKSSQVGSYQNSGIQSRETTSAPSSYYNMIQYGQQNSTTFPYVHIQPQQYPRGQQYIQNWSFFKKCCLVNTQQKKASKSCAIGLVAN